MESERTKPNQGWLLFYLGTGICFMIGLLTYGGTKELAIVVMAVLGSICFIKSAYGLMREPHAIGAPVRATIVVCIIVVGMGLLSYSVWPSGFVQFDKHREVGPPIFGEYLKVNYHFINHGPLPVRDVQSSGGIMFLDPTTNDPQRIKGVWETGFKKYYGEHKGQGIDLSIDDPQFGTAVSFDRLTPKTGDELRDKKLRMFYMIAVGWRNETGISAHYSLECQWVDWTTFPDIMSTVWHNC